VGLAGYVLRRPGPLIADRGRRSRTNRGSNLSRGHLPRGGRCIRAGERVGRRSWRPRSNAQRPALPCGVHRCRRPSAKQSPRWPMPLLVHWCTHCPQRARRWSERAAEQIGRRSGPRNHPESGHRGESAPPRVLDRGWRSHGHDQWMSAMRTFSPVDEDVNVPYYGRIRPIVKDQFALDYL
jgi:hypothetical protein